MKYNPKTAFGNTEIIKELTPKKIPCEDCNGRGKIKHDCIENCCYEDEYEECDIKFERCEMCKGRGYFIK